MAIKQVKPTKEDRVKEAIGVIKKYMKEPTLSDKIFQALHTGIIYANSKLGEVKKLQWDDDVISDAVEILKQYEKSSEPPLLVFGAIHTLVMYVIK